MSSALDLIIQVGHDLTSLKYYGLATFTILLYDYFLTLGDEIKYAWSGKKSWTFWLFLINRYLPITAEIWQIALATSPQSQLGMKVCDKTAWYPIFMFILCTLLAQVVLTLRLYAVTLKNIYITVGFAAITVAQLGLGICLVIFAARSGAQPPPPIPIDAYRLCVFARHRALEVAYTSLSLFYDVLAFSLIVLLAIGSTAGGQLPMILKAIVEDATRYFLVIFSSHFVLVITLNLGREAIQLLPASGNVVYLPVMISRLMLSLKKAADSQQNSWSLGDPSLNGNNIQSMMFFRPQRVTTVGDDIPLETQAESKAQV